jgi:hypothetical protein
MYTYTCDKTLCYDKKYKIIIQTINDLDTIYSIHQETSKMRLLNIVILVMSAYAMHVTCQSYPGFEPVVVEVPGIFGKYGGYLRKFNYFTAYSM